MTSPYLDTRQLEAFVAVISIGSMTGAARALGRSQPVVTRLIQELEAELGFPLLHRNGPRISPTQQGVAFYGQAEMILGGLRTIAERARGIAGAAPQPIEIASLPSLAASVVPKVLAGLTADETPARIHLRTAAAEAIVQAVADRTADIGLTSLPLDNPGVEVHWTAEVPCVAVVACSHRLAGRAEITPEDLVGERLIASHNPYRLRLAINQALGSFDVTPMALIDSNSSPVSMALAREGLGVAVVEPLTTIGLPVAGVAVIPLSFHIPFRFGVITAAGRPLPPLVERLISDFKEQLAVLVPGYRQLDDADTSKLFELAPSDPSMRA
ncbi:LysR family transcriptional regulator [Frigidibacter albus]|uniref:LysR family transcriptional regulator n=2 Tax=Frigidibacter albus TaxID=1465486 RepID=A0A6L8VE80_9RHOB|nr:LysR family transcriptional regulator [Frigidibacter albus]MZQ87540.1 LysR family transcriptional regulator [Frigidibacter albus]NBE29446.1 LysR family transcriptional regulator [Frigidibacter albus]GGH44855.1 transcriptional regulator [Frigidibacter albus]